MEEQSGALAASVPWHGEGGFLEEMRPKLNF